MHALLLDDGFFETFTAFKIPYEPIRRRRDIPAGLVDRAPACSNSSPPTAAAVFMADIDPLMMNSDARPRTRSQRNTYGLILWT